MQYILMDYHISAGFLLLSALIVMNVAETCKFWP